MKTDFLINKNYFAHKSLNKVIYASVIFSYLNWANISVNVVKHIWTTLNTSVINKFKVILYD